MKKRNYGTHFVYSIERDYSDGVVLFRSVEDNGAYEKFQRLYWQLGRDSSTELGDLSVPEYLGIPSWGRL